METTRRRFFGLFAGAVAAAPALPAIVKAAAEQLAAPQQVGALTAWANVSGNYRSGMFLKTDGTLWSWGSSSSGVLGLGDVGLYAPPTPAPATVETLEQMAQTIDAAIARTVRLLDFDEPPVAVATDEPRRVLDLDPEKGTST